MLVATLWLAVVVALPGVVAWAITAVALALLALALPRPTASARVERRDGVAPRRPGPHRGRAPRRGRPPSTPRRPGASPGRDADARAYLLLRPYLKRAVRVEITDPADPTPYWLVSTRHPDELAARSRAGGDWRTRRPAG